MRLRELIAATFVISCLACAEPTQSTVAVWYHGASDSSEFRDPGLARVVLSTEADTVRLRVGHSDSTQGGRPWRSTDIGLGRARWVRADIAMVAGSSDTLGSLTITMPIDTAYRYDFQIVPSAQRWPLSICGGTPAAVRLRSARGQPSAESLFVYYGGLPRDAVC